MIALLVILFIILVSRTIINEKSKCAICLTKRRFIHEIEGKYDLERELEIFSFLPTDAVKEHGNILLEV